MNPMIIHDVIGHEIPLSRVIFGSSNTKFLNGTLDENFLSDCLREGMFTIDTARVYGNGVSETKIGSWMRQNHIPREKVTIITKCSHPVMGILPRVNKRAAFYDIETSLKTLDITYVDVLLLHRDDPLRRPEEIITFMNEILKKGYTRVIGVSNWKADRVKKANDYALSHHMEPFSIIENQFSIGERVRDPWHNGSLSLTGERNRKDREYFQSQHMPILCYSPLGDGFFSGKFRHDDPDLKKKLTPASRSAYYSLHNIEILAHLEELSKKKQIPVATLALSYCLNQPNEMACITSVSSLSRLKENMLAASITLTKEEMDYLS